MRKGDPNGECLRIINFESARCPNNGKGPWPMKVQDCSHVALLSSSSSDSLFSISPARGDLVFKGVMGWPIVFSQMHLLVRQACRLEISFIHKAEVPYDQLPSTRSHFCHCQTGIGTTKWGNYISVRDHGTISSTYCLPHAIKLHY